MFIDLEPTFHLRNYPLYDSSYDTLKITRIESPIKLTTEDDDFTPRVAGYLRAYRFDLRFDHDQLLACADMLSHNLNNIAEYFLTEVGEVSTFLEEAVLSADHILYVEEFYVDPQYRGKNIGIKSLALFFEAFGQGAIVAGCPFPAGEYGPEKTSHLQMQLIRYWSKLGLVYYGAERNILWKENWQMPQWLQDCLWQEI
ncbi:hypothetical protein H6G45_19030 [Synechocystis sp. FACHB-383]|uniref:hypothetical protein n=1 Tax=Synechocystis sp. FACHB-383 TaxID=2692864 RepID=UPI0016837FEC|nr:hypothetical protein [Synechocystis sp. FACHB-383]